MAVESFLPPVVTRLSMNIDDFVGGVAKAKAALKALDSKVDIPVNLNADAAIAKLKTMEGQLKATEAAQQDFASSIRDTNTALLYQSSALDLDNNAITSMSRRLATATAWQGKLKAAVDDTNGALAKQAGAATAAGLATAGASAGGGGGGGGGGWWGWLNNSIPLFNGVFGNSKPLGAISAWHLAIDGALEATIAIVGATLALGAGLAAMAPAATDIYNRLIAIHQVAVSLNGGAGIPPLSGWFEQLQHSVAGQTIGAYGGLVNLMGDPTQYTSTIKQIVDGIDSVVARLDLWRQGQNGLNGVLTHGMGYLSQFTNTVGAVGSAIANLIRADPGTVHVLLGVIQGAAQAIQVFSSMPAPILRSVVALHSAWIWGGLVATVATRLLTPVTKLIALIPAFGAEGAAAFAGVAPVAIGAAVGVAILANAWGSATNAVSRFAAAQNQAANSMAPEQFINSLPAMINSLNDVTAKATTTLPRTVAGLKELGQGLWSSNWGKIGGGVGNAIGGFFTNPVGAFNPSMQVTAEMGNWQKQWTTLISQSGNMVGVLGELMRKGYSAQDAFGLMAMAGIKANDSLTVMQQKVKNLITGYGDLGNSAGFLTNSINAVNFATEQQNSKITAVTQGWSAFIGMITGGGSAFSTFETQIIGLMQTTGQAATTIAVSNGRVTASTSAASAAASASIDGVTSSTLQMYSTFTQGVSDASTMLNTLYTLDSAASLGAKGVSMLGQAGKDVVAQLLPMAKGNQLLTTMAYAVAQQGGYKGGNSWQQMAQWIGNVKNPVKDLLGLLTQFEVAAGNLGTDVKNLAGAIDPTMTSAMSNAILQASGGTASLEKFASAVLNSSGNTALMTSSAAGLWKQMHLVYGNTAQAKDQFEAYAIQLGISQGAADKLWNDLQASGGRSSSAVLKDIAAIQNALAQLNGQTATVHVQTLQSMVTVPGTTSSGYGPLRTGYVIPKTRGFASGTSGAAPGWGWVGEAGPELVRFRGGEQVIPNQVARGYANGTGGDDAVHEINVYLDGRQIYREVARKGVETQRRTGSNQLSKRSR